ncbi:hypothetical protein HOU03_gp430 [Caulobacter phage CcrSC]|uniref:Uncharacterized protein n=1 Tax=Caulobacter phage CcrSC TaxID=2283272 RepID=A0A385EG46_9CAUD|nr:hypothetical protein HOU03_gp430 [Caulobacter phage CcrSC]AXQ69838.1 hypothetical protein CcrSC_gp256c [Caulobacter phage CcrSC]
MTPKFEAFLHDNGYVEFVDMGNGMWAGIKRLMFHWTMHTGEIDNEWSYVDRWCYQTRELASAALRAWAADGFDGEPQGWHKHPKTGRTREGGDPAKETNEYAPPRI